MAKSYARWGGIILLVLGVVGLFAGNSFIGLNTERFEDIIHLVAGALLLYAGTRGTDAQAASWSRIFGIIFLVVGIAGFFWKNLFGLFPAVGLGTLDNVIHLVYGVLGLYAGRGGKMM